MANFSAPQVKMLRKLLARAPRAKGYGNSEKFLLQFVLFEALIRLVGNHYRERINQKKKLTGHEPLNIEVVRRSLAHFCIQISDPLLGNLLDSQRTTRNDKSARNLRNGLAHHWKVEDVKEVEIRFATLSGDLSLAIDKIKMRADNARK